VERNSKLLQGVWVRLDVPIVPGLVPVHQLIGDVPGTGLQLLETLLGQIVGAVGEGNLKLIQPSIKNIFSYL